MEIEDNALVAIAALCLAALCVYLFFRSQNAGSGEIQTPFTEWVKTQYRYSPPPYVDPYPRKHQTLGPPIQGGVIQITPGGGGIVPAGG
jgi:hypothetical protein